MWAQRSWTRDHWRSSCNSSCTQRGSHYTPVNLTPEYNLMRNYMLIVWLNDQERIDLEAWDACRALLSFLHLPRALTKQELLSHAPENQNTQNPSNQMGGITNSPLLRVLKCDCSNQSVLPCLCLEQVDVFICRSFKLIAIGCQMWRVRNLNWANIQVLSTQTIFGQIHFQHLDWGA